MKSQELYSGLATYGKATNMMGTIIITIVAIPFIALGIYFLKKKNTHTQIVNGIIQKVNCTETTDTIPNATSNNPNNTTTVTKYNCNIDVTYNFEGNTYNVKKNTTNSFKYQENQNIDVYINPKNPTDIKLDVVNNKTIGLFLIGIPILILIIVYVSLYFTLKYKSIAAASGTTTGISQIKRIFN